MSESFAQGTSIQNFFGKEVARTSGFSSKKTSYIFNIPSSYLNGVTLVYLFSNSGNDNWFIFIKLLINGSVFFETTVGTWQGCSLAYKGAGEFIYSDYGSFRTNWNAINFE